MTPRWFLLLTAVTTLLAAGALFYLPWAAGVFPGGVFADATVGPVPLWVLCTTILVLLAIVCAGALAMARSHPRPPG
jgi:membrane protein DedA with SNARE-associated domain